MHEESKDKEIMNPPLRAFRVVFFLYANTQQLPGFRDRTIICQFQHFKCQVQSSSSLCPPDKNAIPGTAGGTVGQSAVTVYSAITSGFQRKASHQRSSSRVSSKRMTPERKRRAFGDVKRSSRRDWRLDSMFSTLMLARRLPMVPVLSSAAKIPFPGVAMYLAFWISSSGEYQNKAFGYRDI
ncbi:hypothetical protein QYF36_012779 [Acer negundo]|nr:hypothetical protein QYF36_012779 [Acer negundo]